MLIFAQKYKKKVDRDIIVTLIGVLVAVFLGWVENRGKAAKAKKAAKPAPRPKPTAAAHTHVKPARPEKVAIKKPAPAPAPAPAKAAATFLNTSEGERVTHDPIKKPAPEPKPSLKPLDRDQLRNAVIWGEILQRKF